MSNRFFLQMIFIIISSKYALSQNTTKQKFGIHTGFTINYAQSNQIGLDIFVGTRLPRKTKKLELNIGFTKTGNKTNFDGVDLIKFNTYGLFLEGNYFRNQNFYLGGRLSVNMSWVQKASQEYYILNRPLDPPTFFSGSIVCGTGGYRITLSKKLIMNINIQVGVHNYKIGTGGIYFSNMDILYDPLYHEEKQSKLIYNAGIGIVYSLK